MACCKCRTTYKIKETDLVFKVSFVFQEYVPSQPSSNEGWYWVYAVGVPTNGQDRTIGVYSKVKGEYEGDENITTSCDCADTSGGSQSNRSRIDDDNDVGGDYSITYAGYWRSRRTGRIVRGHAEWRGYRHYVMPIYETTYVKEHQCGRECPGAWGDNDWDDLQYFIDQCESQTPY